MDNIKFYYIEDEHESNIFLLDEKKEEAYLIDRLCLTSISKIEYPSGKYLKNIIKESKNSGYDGSWNDILFILENKNIILSLIDSNDRDEYISSIQNDDDIIELNKYDYLFDRFWELFENQSQYIGNKYKHLYSQGVNYFDLLSDNEIDTLFEQAKKLSNKEYLYLIINNANIVNININLDDFSL